MQIKEGRERERGSLTVCNTHRTENVMVCTPRSKLHTHRICTCSSHLLWDAESSLLVHLFRCNFS